MGDNMNQKGFKSKFGFVFAAIGSAVGLGNIWSFPYKLSNGGVVFFCIYIILSVIVGIPLLISEICIGRNAKGSVIDAYKNVSPKLKCTGILAVISPCIVMSYYSVIGGLCVKYFFINLKAVFFGFSFDDGIIKFEQATSNVFSSVVFTIVFIGLTYIVSCRGISDGIEKFNIFAVPLLFLILSVSLIRNIISLGVSDTFNIFLNSSKGIKITEVISIFSSAGEQMFFSLSIAVGTMITYGSLMNKKQDIPLAATTVSVADSLVAILAGLTIIPAAYPDTSVTNDASGPDFLFITMQKVFLKDFEIGAIFGTLFFLFVIIAALSSAVAFIEVPVNAIENTGGNNRKWVLVICCIIISAPAVVIASDGFKNNVLEICMFVAEGLFIPVTALITSVYLGWFGGIKIVLKELEKSRYYNFCKKIFPFVFKYLAPLVLITVLIGQIVGFMDIS